MVIRQLSVSIDNVPGTFSNISELLGREGVNIRAISVADTSDISTVRFVVDDPEKAKNILIGRGYSPRETDVLAVEIPDHPGATNTVLKPLRPPASTSITSIRTWEGSPTTPSSSWAWTRRRRPKRCWRTVTSRPWGRKPTTRSHGRARRRRALGKRDGHGCPARIRTSTNWSRASRAAVTPPGNDSKRRGKQTKSPPRTKRQQVYHRDRDVAQPSHSTPARRPPCGGCGHRRDASPGPALRRGAPQGR